MPQRFESQFLSGERCQADNARRFFYLIFESFLEFRAPKSVAVFAFRAIGWCVTHQSAQE
jgi:hypothetical protein